jgi:ABC-type lipoprotein release transport system permease subunit
MTLLALIFIFLQAFQICQVRGQGSHLIQGFVLDAKTGDPIENATILLIDDTTGARVLTFTGSMGQYNLSVEDGHNYRIYAYVCVNDSYNYVPTRTASFWGQEARNTNFSLYPGASIHFSEDVYWVESPWPSKSITFTVIDSLTEASINISNLIGPYAQEPLIQYGDVAEDAVTIGLDRRLVIVPANVSVDVYVSARVKNQTANSYQTIQFTVDNDEKHFQLQQGESVTVDIRKYALKLSFDIVEKAIEDTRNFLSNASEDGFYVSSQRAELNDRVLPLLNEAQTYYDNGNYDASYYRASYDKLREAYGILRLINQKVMDMYNAALAIVSSVLPQLIFLGSTAVVLAFFSFEKDKQKMIAAPILYAIFSLIFYFMYPGTKLIHPPLLLSVITLSLATVFSVAFILPRVVRVPAFWEWEKEVIARRDAATAILSIAKRNIKRHKLLGTLNILSMILLIATLVTFASFSTVYGLTQKPLPKVAPSEGLQIRNVPATPIPGGSPFLSLDQSDIDWLETKSEVKVVAPKAENTPNLDPIASLNKMGRAGRIQIFGIVGLLPNVEGNFTQINSIERLNAPDSILISTNTSDLLDVRAGDTVQLSFTNASGPQIWNLTVAGIFENETQPIGSVTDLDGDSIVPFKLVYDLETNETSVVRCDASEIIILNYEAALKLPSTVISRINIKADPYQVLVRDIVIIRGYHVFIASPTGITEAYMGYYQELRGLAIIIPLVITALNVGMTMLNAVYERRREIMLLSVTGLNPRHIMFLFLAEAMIIGVIGGTLGYLVGIGTFRVLSWLPPQFQINIEMKLSPTWNLIGVAFAVSSAVLAGSIPSYRATKLVIPTKIKFLEERKFEMPLRGMVAAKVVDLPVSINAEEIEFFMGYIHSRVSELAYGYRMRVDGLETKSEEEKDGTIIKRVKFNFHYVTEGGVMTTLNEIIATMKPDVKNYKLKLSCTPITEKVQDKIVYWSVSEIREWVMEWAKRREKLMTGR